MLKNRVSISQKQKLVLRRDSKIDIAFSPAKLQCPKINSKERRNTLNLDQNLLI